MNFLTPNDEHVPPKQELIGDCLNFYLMNLLRCVDAILNKIGEGGFGSVYLCFNGKRENNLYAVKCIKSSESINSGDRERQFGYISKLNSPYLVNIKKHSHFMMIYML
jgi:hypothetical protein